ncbi:SDR family NAD(P)-dependent oxidoreductase [Actinokineospora soli]|uniref:SDR family NAD(P)-dependent oxidoreductase n=1 Tax=Actinokineospora soli TaxID=1048753 RepID=A0ABW2TUB9_9PSEU
MTALITGGTAGVGLALARLLAADRPVTVCGRDPDRLAAAEREGLRALPADLADPADVDRLAAAAPPGLDLLVHNAAVQLDRDWTTADPDALVADVHRELAIDLAAPMRLTARLLPVLATTRNPVIVTITSALGPVPKRSAPVYCAAKAGLIAFSTSLRYQTPVRVVDVMLPLVDTAMTAGRGAGKISPDAAARAVLRALRSRRDTVRVGKAKVLIGLHRLAPRLAAKVVAD